MNKSLLRSLIVIALVAVVLLAATFGLQSLAVKNARAEHLRIMRTLLPGSTDFVVEPYTGEDANIRSVHKADEGFVIETATQGYADEIIVLVGVDNDGTVTGISILKHAETPGLGAIAGAASNVGIEWRSQFQNIPSAAVTKDGGQINPISGATITSRAVCNGVTAAQNAVKTVG